MRHIFMPVDYIFDQNRGVRYPWDNETNHYKKKRLKDKKQYTKLNMENKRLSNTKTNKWSFNFIG